jgi:hypothetical protein
MRGGYGDVEASEGALEVGLGVDVDDYCVGRSGGVGFVGRQGV